VGPTLKDIAGVTGYSLTTVSRALGGFNDVAESTRAHIRRVADELGYVPNLTARRLKKQQTGTIGFIIPTADPRLTDPFFMELLSGFGNQAGLHDYDLLVSTHAPGSDREKQAYLRAVRGGWVDGLLVVRTREKDPRIDLLLEHQFPFVAFGRTAEQRPFSYVDEDSIFGMRLLVEHFWGLGHRRIGFVSPPAGLMFGRLRRQGFLETLAAHGVESRPEWVIAGDMTRRSGRRAAARLLALNPRPTAIIGGNDLMAIGILEGVQAAGLTVGTDVAVGGFDDVYLAAHTAPPLTTVRQPIYEIAFLVAETLVEMLTGRLTTLRQHIMEPTLVVRASSGGPVREEDVH
jgi:LacI family transcriptional regulator